MTFSLPQTNILVAVDVVVIAIVWWTMQVLLVQRSDIKKPSWVLPWWFIDEKETLSHAAKRKLWEETGYNKFAIYEVWVFDDVKRDPRARIISSAFLALTNHIDFPFTDGYHTKNAQFYDIDQLPHVLYDHKKIIAQAICKLQSMILTTNIAKNLLPKKFTLTELQKICETILGKPLNVRNFRTKLIEEKLVVPTWEMQIGVWHRPAEYYMFSAK